MFDYITADPKPQWTINEAKAASYMDLALAGGWLPVSFGNHPDPAGGLCSESGAKPEACAREIQARIRS